MSIRRVGAAVAMSIVVAACGASTTRDAEIRFEHRFAAPAGLAATDGAAPVPINVAAERPTDGSAPAAPSPSAAAPPTIAPTTSPSTAPISTAPVSTARVSTTTMPTTIPSTTTPSTKPSVVFDACPADAAVDEMVIDAAVADIDGDGELDKIAVVSSPDGSPAVRVSLAVGGPLRVDLPSSDLADGVHAVLGSVQFDDGPSEALVLIGGSPPAALVLEPYDCELREVELLGAIHPSPIPVGGDDPVASLSCVGQQLRLGSFERIGDEYRGTIVAFEKVGAVFEPVAEESMTIDASDEEAVADLRAVRCGERRGSQNG